MRTSIQNTFYFEIIFFKLFVMLLFSTVSWGQTNIVKYDLSVLAGGINNYGASPLTPTTFDSNVTIVGLTRGIGMTTTGTAAAKAWGGLAGNTSLTKATGISSNNTASFTITPNAGYKVSLTQIPAYNIRRSGTGFTTGIWQYSVNGGAYADIGVAITWGTTTTATGNAQSAITLSGIAALQNVTTSIALRVVLWSASGTGTWYFNNQVSGTNDLIVTGTLASITSTPTITLSPATLTGFTYLFGSGPSTEQTFNASGTSLTANISIVPPTDYEISTLTGGSFVATNPITLTQFGGTVSSTPIYVRLKAGLSAASYTSEIIAATSTGAANQNVTCSGNVTSSFQSDIIAIAASETSTIVSTINNPAPLTSSTGIQVWQFKVRDGGATLNDSDALPTILTGFTLAQDPGNTVSTWTDAIQTLALFDGTTLIATGTVTANQIQFSGLNISVADNTDKSLTLRLSLKCPLGADAFDGEDFVFSLSNANTTFSASGSGKKIFSAQTSTNGSNVINVVASKLAFEVQPITTGVNGPMSPSVKVKATDSCGNLDSGFNGAISITSSGTLAPTTVTATTINGIATFSLTHTTFGTGYFLYASATGLTVTTSTTFDIINTTVLQPGDIAILAFNSAIANGDDEISFVALVDILPGTRIDITDNAYQKCGTPNGWGISEGWIRIERINTILPKGTIVTIRIDNTGMPYIYSPDPANWISSKPQPNNQGIFNLSKDGEQIFLMSGGNVGGPSGTISNLALSDAGTYSGIFLFGFNTIGNVWGPVCGDSDAGGTKNSDKPLNFDCFLTCTTEVYGWNKYTGLNSEATKREWIKRIKNPSNWTYYADNTAYDAGPNYHAGSISNIAGGYFDGVWIGDSSNNWFECGNWQSLKVPDETVNVVFGSNAVQSAKIDYTALSSDLFSDIAKCYDLTISKKSVEIFGNNLNQMKIYGNLKIESGGTLDMDDSNSLTNDGQLFLYGNWTNSSSEAAFQEGNGTVHLLGNTTQVINSNVHNNPEEFYNIVLDNNFNTATSNNLIATGNLEVKTNKNFIVASNDYAIVNKKLTNNGSITIDNNGQLIQVDENVINDGDYSGTNFKVNRIATINKFDYVYWSSPVDNFDISSITGSYKYLWNTTINNTNGTQGNWTTASGPMTKGKGYIVRAPNTFPIRPAAPTTLPVTFLGKPNNGQFDFAITRGTYDGGGYDADLSNPTNEFTTKYDDNWNLVGNPYPSAIDAEAFLVLNSSKIEGAVWIWKHGTAPSTTNANPFYQNYGISYSSSDYLKYNKLGSSEPSTFDGKIASGQGFMVNMLHIATLPNNITFKNSLRAATHDNTNFYRNANELEEKSRIWLNIVNSTSGRANTTLIGYATNATQGEDHLYDCVFIPEGELALYSLINSNPFVIQGRGLPFDTNDIVPLGIKIMENGTHKIAVNTVDGLFENTSTGIYLEDRLLNIVHDLRQSPYLFTTNIGRIDNRFLLRYTNEALENPSFEAVANAVLVANKNNQINIQSSIESIESVTVYDVLGRLLFEKSKLKNNTFIINNLAVSNQTLIVKIVLENRQTVTKKIVF